MMLHRFGQITAVVTIAAVGCGESPSGPPLVASVAIAPDTATLQVGQTRQLSAATRDAAGTVLAGRDVTWSSLSEALATVSQQGLVTAVAPGLVTVTATSEGRSGTAQITVVPVPVASVVIAPDTATLQVGQTRQLSATTRDAADNVLAGRAVTWSSSSEAFGTVSQQGLVTAVAPGLVTVTATSEGRGGTAQITVVPVPVASVVIAPDTATLQVGQTRQLSAATRDAAGDVLTGRDVTWSSSSEALATVSQQGLVTAVAPGLVTVTATSEGRSGTAHMTVVPCASTNGDENEIAYSWSLETRHVTITNKNECDTIFVWATTTPLCTGCENIIMSVLDEVNPGETIVVPAGVPAHLGWKPEVIYSTANGQTFAYHPLQAGSAGTFHFDVILLDFSENHRQRLSEFAEMFAIDPDETRRGDCQDFSWVHRNTGEYQVVPSSTGSEAYCFVGNIRGFTAEGDARWLPALRYFVTNRSAALRWPSTAVGDAARVGAME